MQVCPNVAVEDGIRLDLEDGHGGCWGLSEGCEGVGKRDWVCCLLFRRLSKVGTLFKLNAAEILERVYAELSAWVGSAVGPVFSLGRICWRHRTICNMCGLFECFWYYRCVSDSHSEAGFLSTQTERVF
jgi:hypothetical protein